MSEDAPLRVGYWLVEPPLNRISCEGEIRELELRVMALLLCFADSLPAGAQPGTAARNRLGRHHHQQLLVDLEPGPTTQGIGRRGRPTTFYSHHSQERLSPDRGGLP